ncbi:MAG: hypothetical protein ACQERZ_03900 [Fusobacteriota bacterium]
MKKIIMVAIGLNLFINVMGADLIFYGSLNTFGKWDIEVNSNPINEEEIPDSDTTSGFSLGGEFLEEIAPNFDLGLGGKYETEIKRINPENEDEKKKSGLSTLPIYLMGRYNFVMKNEEFKPYLIGRGGYNLIFVNGENRERAEEESEENHTGGIYYGVGVGVEYRDLICSLVYDVSSINFEYSEGTYYFELEEKYSKVGFNIGYKIEM